jgi:predicted dienelactone hydrolase
MGGPVEFPDVAERVPELMASSEVFRQSWDRQGEDFTDGRIKAIAAIAPAPTVRAFVASSLESITLPVAMITGGADKEAPKTQCADWLAELNPSFVNHDAGSLVRHYTFLGLPSDPGKGRQNPIFKDHATVDRSQIQSDTAKRITSHFGFALNG